MVKFTDFLRDTVMVGPLGQKRAVRVAGRLEFTVEGVPCVLVNALRRTVLSDVETVAFAFDAGDPAGQDVKFLRNDGALHNEFVGERIGLLPLHLTREQVAAFDPDRVTFTIDVENATRKFRDVTSKDIAISVAAAPASGAASEPAPPKLDRDAVFPPDPVTGDHPLIARLKPETKGVREALRLEARARVGTGREHVRWSPVSNCVCFPLPDEEKVKRARARYTGDATRFDAVERMHEFATDERGRALTSRFTIESVCGLRPEEVFDEALARLAARFGAVAEAAAAGGSGRVKAVETASREDGKNSVDTIRLERENETLAAPLQDWLHTHARGEVEWAGYFVPHPLDSGVVVRVAMKPQAGASAMQVVARACEGLRKEVEVARKTWLVENGRTGRAP